MYFICKARWVLDGHKKPGLVWLTYSGVVSRDSVRIAFTYAALNGIEVCVADIRNACLQGPLSQKYYIMCGSVFGIEDVGMYALVWRALYGGKSAGKYLWNHLRSFMSHLDFSSCPANPYVWMRPDKQLNGTDYYEFILLYTDNALVISENSDQVLRKDLGRYLELKENLLDTPKYILEDLQDRSNSKMASGLVL